jgi:hypothetical protein
MISFLKKIFSSQSDDDYYPEYDLRYTDILLTGRFIPPLDCSSIDITEQYDTIEYGSKKEEQSKDSIKTFTLPDGSVVCIDTDKTDISVKSKLEI